MPVYCLVSSFKNHSLKAQTLVRLYSVDPTDSIPDAGPPLADITPDLDFPLDFPLDLVTFKPHL